MNYSFGSNRPGSRNRYDADVNRRIFLFGLFLSYMATSACRANELKNADFSAGLSGWVIDGKGELVYLLPNQSEGKKGDGGAYPAVKLMLSEARAVVMFQDFQLPDHVTAVNLQVDVLPTKDFKRIQRKDTKKGWEIGLEMPIEDGGPFDADFWIRGPRWATKLLSLQSGIWNHLEANFRVTKGLKAFHLEYNVAPGDGSVYITSPSATSN